MALATRVFEPELMKRHGYTSLRQLARAMQMNDSSLVLVRQGNAGIGRKFIEGARLAYPGYSLEYLFPSLFPTEAAS